MIRSFSDKQIERILQGERRPTIPPEPEEVGQSPLRRCNPEYNLRLSRYFGIEAGYWMRLQLSGELQRTERENREAIRRIRKASTPAA